MPHWVAWSHASAFWWDMAGCWRKAILKSGGAAKCESRDRAIHLRRLLQDADYEAFEVVGFGHGEEDGVVFGLGAAVDDGDGAFGIGGGFGQDLEEEGFADVVR